MFGMSRWLRRKFKPKMRPIPAKEARRMVDQLSLIYAFVGWNAVTFAVYILWGKHVSDGPDKVRNYLDIMSIDKADVIEFNGLQKVSEYEIDRRKEYSQQVQNLKRYTNTENSSPEPPKEENDSSTIFE